MGKVRQYPYFVRPFHTSTPLRSVELRMKKEIRDLVASTGHLWEQASLPLRSQHSSPALRDDTTRMKTSNARKNCDALPDVFVDAEIPSGGVTNDVSVIRFTDQG